MRMQWMDELTNMISGQARKDLVGMGMILEEAIPRHHSGGAPHSVRLDQRDFDHSF